MAMSARQVLDAYWNGALPVPVIHIANEMGISVFKQSKLDCSGKIELSDDGKASVFFNTDEPIVRQRFTIAHEIGHFALGHLKPGVDRLHRDSVDSFSSKSKDPIEISANKFAAQLLMPADSVRYAFLSEKLSITEIAQMFNVSGLALRFRLINLGLIHG